VRRPGMCANMAATRPSAPELFQCIASMQVHLGSLGIVGYIAGVILCVRHKASQVGDSAG
jgi:hypothetical protein